MTGPIEFRLAPHSIKPAIQIVEVLLDGKVVAAIYPDAFQSCKIISAHMRNIEFDDGRANEPPLPSVTILFEPREYRIEGDQIIREPE